MHPNPAFRGNETAANLDFARARGFGMLVLTGPDGPLAAHVPFLIAPDGGSVGLHLARSNPVLRAAAVPVPALLAVTGPDGYVSPDWYGLPDQVPTWNYVAVHLRGLLRVLPASALRPHSAALSAEFEGRLPKPPWTHHKMDSAALARMERMIVPVEMVVETVEGTWKLNQNKPEAARQAAAAQMAESGVGHETATLAALMRAVPTT